MLTLQIEQEREEREMKALTDNGIDEATIEVGTLVNWQSKDYGQNADVVSYIERDGEGGIIRIAFGSWLKIFTDRMKLDVELCDRKTPALKVTMSRLYTNEMAQIGRWYTTMQRRELITVN